MKPRFIVADRRDLLGGRLVPILNGLRIARRLDAKFLMTWDTDDGDFQSYVQGLREIFADWVVEPYDEATGSGTIIPVDHPFARAPGQIRTLPCAASAEFGIGDLFVEPVFDGDVYRLDRRFSCYRLLSDETFPLVAAELREEFWRFPNIPSSYRQLARLKTCNERRPTCMRGGCIHTPTQKCRLIDLNLTSHILLCVVA